MKVKSSNDFCMKPKGIFPYPKVRRFLLIISEIRLLFLPSIISVRHKKILVPKDCSKFVNCWRGVGKLQSCAPGTVFNAARGSVTNNG